jgi:hypothetical protein
MPRSAPAAEALLTEQTQVSLLTVDATSATLLLDEFRQLTSGGMQMKRLVLAGIISVAASLAMVVSGGLTAAAAPESNGSLATVSYTITYTCTAGPGCIPGTSYVHTYSISLGCNGAITGTGTQVGFPLVLEAVSGAIGFDVVTSTVTVRYVSTYVGSLVPGYMVTANGTLNPRTGALTGTATTMLPGDPSADASFTLEGVRNSFAFGGTSCSGDSQDNDDDEGDD